MPHTARDGKKVWVDPNGKEREKAAQSYPHLLLLAQKLELPAGS